MPSDHNGQFFVWAEDVTRLRHKPRRAIAQKSNPRHPFQAILSEVALLVSGGTETTLRLPSLPEGRPFPSPLLPQGHGYDGGAPPENQTPVLRPWSITGLGLEPADAVTWLASLPVEPPQFYQCYGDDLRYWTALARLVLELLARERFVPTLRTAEPSEARWELLLTDPADRERVQALAAALPPICRAALPRRTDPARHPVPAAMDLPMA